MIWEFSVAIRCSRPLKMLQLAASSRVKDWSLFPASSSWDPPQLEHWVKTDMTWSKGKASLSIRVAQPTVPFQIRMQSPLQWDRQPAAKCSQHQISKLLVKLQSEIQLLRNGCIFKQQGATEKFDDKPRKKPKPSCQQSGYFWNSCPGWEGSHSL